MPKFAAIQIETQLLDVEQNLAKSLHWLGKAHAAGVQVAVLPECVLTGYDLTPEEVQHAAQLLPGPHTQSLLQFCRETGMLVVLGLLEKDPDGQVFNTAVMLGPQGIMTKYRKIHLPYLGLDRYITGGSEISPPQNTAYGKLGMLICYDLRFPEPVRVLALQGVQVLLLPTSWPQAASFYPDFMAQSRAAENGIFLVAADRIGNERGTPNLGRSLIIDPDGKILAEAGRDQEEMLVAEMEPLRSDQKTRVQVPGVYQLDLFADRRPELYVGIAAKHSAKEDQSAVE